MNLEGEAGKEKQMERPVTRWRREMLDKTVKKIESNEIERPTSRRGIKEEIEEYGSSFRSATPAARNAPLAVRAPSASISGLSRLNTGLSMSGLERPITQHGIASIRPGTAGRGTSMTRQVQDKRYYEGLVQLKMRELSQEMATIVRDIDMQNKERATILHYDKRAKDLAGELTALQGELADYNIVVDKMSSNIEKESMDQETKELLSRNERSMAEIEDMFERRQEMEQRLRRTEKEMGTVRERTEKLIDMMDPGTRERYEILRKEKVKVEETIALMQEELEVLSKEQGHFEEQMALSPFKQEAVKLHVKIMDGEYKRDKLREEEGNRLSPEKEREELLVKIKQDNMEMAAAEAQLAGKKKRLAEVEVELERLETDLEDGNADKQTKYKELRKREEVMEQFAATFDDNKAEEMERIKKLEISIVEYLERISNGGGMDGDGNNLTRNEEILLILNKSKHDDYYDTAERTKTNNINNNRSFEVLRNDYIDLKETLRKLEILEDKLRLEIGDINEQTHGREYELIQLEDFNGFKAKDQMKREDANVEHKRLMDERTIGEVELKTVNDDYKRIKERFNDNRIFLEIEALEKKLIDLREENKKSNDLIVRQKEQVDYLPRKQQALKLMKEYSTILEENSKTLY
ncbi:intraflagellar transport protein 74 homolog [Vespa mandarinia]|uniref:intraflagellar transport protein 74 homolog n=1 Tax=Vespa mandarinia TaxID=7446 RepID=UPI00161442C9|nr:intraflagellar transport protein 74 homolog [Vespa mandarinia]